MAKVKTIKFKRTGKNGDVFEYSADVNVQESGTFTIPFPEALGDTVDSRLEKLKYEAKCRLKCIYTRGKERIECTVLKEGEDFINSVIDEHLACESVTERVIVYGHTAHVSYVKDAKTGAIYSNGHYCDYGTPGFDWRGSSESNHCSDHDQMYSVGLTARVFDRTTHTRATTTKVTWAEAKFEDDNYRSSIVKHAKCSGDDYHPISMLNSFVHQHIDPDGSQMKVMPYSDKAAIFFYNLMIGLCGLADRIDTFFSKPQNVLDAIERGQNLLMSAPAQTLDKTAKSEV